MFFPTIYGAIALTIIAVAQIPITAFPCANCSPINLVVLVNVFSVFTRDFKPCILPPILV